MLAYAVSLAQYQPPAESENRPNCLALPKKDLYHSAFGVPEKWKPFDIKLLRQYDKIVRFVGSQSIILLLFGRKFLLSRLQYSSD